MMNERMKKSRFYLIGLAVWTGMLGLSACSQTPLQKLTSDHLYPDLNSAYWAKEQDNKTSLWADAVSYCKQHTDKPNCSAVIEVYAVTHGSTQSPAIGYSGHPIHAP